MRRPVIRTIFMSYAVAWLYLAGFVLAEVIYAALSPHDQAAVIGWAGTNVVNLRHHAVGSLVDPAFVTQTFATAWPALIALGTFGANRMLGNWRTALVCAAGQVTGPLVSEGIAGYRYPAGSFRRWTGTSSTPAPRTWSCPRSWWPCCTAHGRREP
ncbi:MAG: rhomboid-like protein [Streptosporangiaceae bacterium]